MKNHPLCGWIFIALADRYHLWTDDTAANAGLFGRGDSVATMVLPNWTDRMVQFAGDDAGASIAAGLPNITGAYNTRDSAADEYQGAIRYTSQNKVFMYDWISNKYGNGIRSFDAARSNPIYGASATVQPPAIKLIPVIRY